MLRNTCKHIHEILKKTKCLLLADGYVKEVVPECIDNAEFELLKRVDSNECSDKFRTVFLERTEFLQVCKKLISHAYVYVFR